MLSPVAKKKERKGKACDTWNQITKTIASVNYTLDVVVVAVHKMFKAVISWIDEMVVATHNKAHILGFFQPDDSGTLPDQYVLKNIL